MFRTRLDGSEVLNANEKFVELVGQTRDEIIGRPSVIHWVDPNRREEMVRLLKAHGRVVDFEFQVVNKKRDVRDCLTSLNLYPEEGILDGSIVDITERKRAVEDLRSVSSELRRTLDTSATGLTHCSRSLRYLSANAAYARWIGLPQEQIVGRPIVEVMGQAAFEIIRPRVERVLRGERVEYEDELPIAGALKPIHVIYMPDQDPSGNIVGWVASVTDITELKRAEKALQEKEKRYRSLFESAKDGIFILGSKGFIDCNQKGADMYGLPKEKVIGRSPIDFSPLIQPNGLSSSRLAGEIIESAMKGVPKTFEWQSMRADGSFIDVEINLSRFELGGEICLQAIVRDITERKKLEQELLKSQRLESLGILAGGIAHDFNNLLQAMMGNISLAKILTNPGEKVFPLLKEAEKASEQAKELSYRLLTFSKGGDPVRRIISLEDVLEASISLSLSGSKVACDLSLPKDLNSVEADKGQINQVFNNLLINAKEAMPEGGTIEISAANVRVTGRDNLPLKEGNYVRVSLADHGTGIPEKYLPRIFDPYFSTKDRGSEKGMGLGLAICYSIVAKHEGYIAVESRMGVGTSFHVYLPATERNYEEGPGRESRFAPGKGRVLFMDDDERVRKITGAMLEQLGYEVEFARNGEEAIERYRRAKEAGQTFDAAILDLTVQGGMGGEKAVGRLLEIDPEVKTVVSSGYADDPVMKEFGRYGFVDALAKPYNAEALKRLLARATLTNGNIGLLPFIAIDKAGKKRKSFVVSAVITFSLAPGLTRR